MPATTLPTAAPLLDALERTGPHPVLAWYGESSRIELSGHVLANWVIKAIGHLDAEIALDPGDLVAIDMPPHWKRLVLALAAWSLGGEVQVIDLHGGDLGTAAEEGRADDAAGAAAGAPSSAPVRVLITDRPDGERAEDADEVLAVDPVSLAPRFSAELPALAHDWVQEVRASSDQLDVALPPWSGPQPLTGAAPDGDGASPGVDGPPAGGDSAPEDSAGSPAGSPRLLVEGDGLAAVRRLLDALLRGGGMVAPAGTVTAHQAHEEGVTARV